MFFLLTGRYFNLPHKFVVTLFFGQLKEDQFVITFQNELIYFFYLHCCFYLSIDKDICESSKLGSIVKLGEGTYGEAYRAGSTVCKVVPFDGDSLVNGETQKVYFIHLGCSQL